MESQRRQVTYECVECDEFEFTKSYTGVPGTRGEAEFEETGEFDECVVCGGDIETSVENGDV